MAALTPRQERFVEEYLRDLNATQAAIRSGYSARSAAEIGRQLLEKTGVAEAVARAKAERSARLGLTQDRVLEELAAVAFARLGDYAEWGPDRFVLRDSESGGDDGGRIDSRVVQEIKVKETVLSQDDEETVLKREYGIKLHDKLAALKLLGQHIGMFAERHTVTLEIKREAQEIAEELGIPVEQVYREAGVDPKGV